MEKKKVKTYKKEKGDIHAKHFPSFEESESWESDNLPRDLLSFSNGSEFCETDSLALASFRTVIFPLEDLDSEWPFSWFTLLSAYGSIRCTRGQKCKKEMLALNSIVSDTAITRSSNNFSER